MLLLSTAVMCNLAVETSDRDTASEFVDLLLGLAPCMGIVSPDDACRLFTVLGTASLDYSMAAAALDGLTAASGYPCSCCHASGRNAGP